mmetsp:Transcript_85378/g.178403  ORF Transcript_85378/g.178403 Transcript_85378/m.178403 type:complete len:445 (-) Transcript_85378:63-1397(-)|eukprot:CAMPEP_0206445910 /NCGR_PEP_ID=MMETSP0324_2-20121206/15807_1 /ASSEMBLY_ACC=CAM_ASM_000836 /TAXON_ID=2866 /ORGANISM="Crypthecodinium cohnii, Strain Seligo" /LENGTH=444 /DNA_ID=CAMNT_0053914251 /DNA_START=78 /DNA_END=1412 /DNA_ORIENTATION=-
MQTRGSKAALQLFRASRRAGPSQARCLMAQQRHNSFIKQVMDQVKRDMENDPKMKQDWEKAQKATKRMQERSQTFEGRMSEFGERLSETSSKTAEVFSKFRESAANRTSAASAKINEATEGNESLKKAAEYMKAGSETVGGVSKSAFEKTKGAFSGIMDTSSKAFSWIGDSDKKGEKTQAWKEARHSMKAHMDAKAAAEAAAKKEAEGVVDGATAKATAAEGDAKTASKEETKVPPEPESALVVSEAKSSSWDRFGAGLRDMPFLSSVFENPLFDRIFGESEIAAAIREMKEEDYSFRLEEFAEDIEYIVAPHIIKTYLEGDQEALQKHCGEAAFNAVNASIKERLKQKLSLDPDILAGPREMQLVSAKLNDKAPPSFIWTFQMQQVNCLRDAEGEVVEGAVDDIRTVCYAMVVNRHPEVETVLDLEYPWQITELAILWNQPCF